MEVEVPLGIGDGSHASSDSEASLVSAGGPSFAFEAAAPQKDVRRSTRNIGYRWLRRVYVSACGYGVAEIQALNDCGKQISWELGETKQRKTRYQKRNPKKRSPN